MRESGISCNEKEIMLPLQCFFNVLMLFIRPEMIYLFSFIRKGIPDTFCLMCKAFCLEEILIKEYKDLFGAT